MLAILRTDSNHSAVVSVSDGFLYVTKGSNYVIPVHRMNGSTVQTLYSEHRRNGILNTLLPFRFCVRIVAGHLNNNLVALHFGIVNASAERAVDVSNHIQVCGDVGIHKVDGQSVLGQRLLVISAGASVLGVDKSPLHGAGLLIGAHVHKVFDEEIVGSVVSSRGLRSNLVLYRATLLIDAQFHVSQVIIRIDFNNSIVVVQIRRRHVHFQGAYGNLVIIDIDVLQVIRKSRGSAERNHCDDQHERQKHRK